LQFAFQDENTKLKTSFQALLKEKQKNMKGGLAKENSRN
jgi:hypothetical protein